jgi:hypothetical protein
MVLRAAIGVLIVSGAAIGLYNIARSLYGASGEGGAP